MALLDDLYNQATGLLTSMNERGKAMQQDDPTSTDLQSPITNQQGVVPSTLPSVGQKGKLFQQRPVGIPQQQQTPMNDVREIAKNPGLFQRVFGMDTKTFAQNWKDKGGYEGLMANPGFLLGLGIIQSSAQGKPIGSDIFDIAVKTGAVSSQYADRIKARRGILAPVTDAQRDEVAAVLAEDNYYEPDYLDRLKTGNQQAKYREALDDVYSRAELLVKAESKKLNKKIRLERRHVRAAIKQLEESGQLKKRDPSFFGIRGGTLESTKGIKKRKDGGPVEKGEAYIVGEKGQEMFIPETDGNIIDNDDTKVVNMLLESNPQLKNVSRARAVKILKARFPDYF